MVLLDFNELSQIELPQVFLCHRNTVLKNGVKTVQKYGELSPVLDLTIKMNCNSPDELSFTVPKNADGREIALWDQITDFKIVQIPKFGNFEIYVQQTNDEYTELKKVTGKSIEVELGQILLFDFEVNTLDQIGADKNYVPIVFYNPTDAQHSLLHLALQKAPAWSIGHVDESLWEKQRSFEADGTAIYDFLTGEVSDELECIFVFDSFNRVVNCYDLAAYGSDTTIYVSKENLCTEINLEADAAQVKNCFKVTGGDGITISSVNPNGTEYIWMLTEHDKADMSNELLKRLNDYDLLYSSKTEEYTAVIEDMHNSFVQITALINKLSSSTDPYSDLTNCGLVQLKTLRDSLQAVEDTYITLGYGDVRNEGYETFYTPNHNKLLAVEAEIKARNSEIDILYENYDGLKEQRDNIQGILDLEQYLTVNGDKSLWYELSMYRREDSYNNPNYAAEDNSTAEELFEMERALYEEAVKELGKASTPQYHFSVNMNNILASSVFNRDGGLEKFKVGNFIRVGTEDDEFAKVRLISIEIDFNDLSNIQVEFSDTVNSGGVLTDASSIIAQAVSAATSYDTVKKQYNSAKDSIDFVSQIKRDGLNAALVAIMNSGSQTTVFDEHGILCRQWNEQKQDYEQEQLKIINNLLCYTDDNWKSVRQAIGKIKYEGEDVYGVIADALIGTILAGNHLIITNENNTFIVDETGATLTDASFTVQKGDITIVMNPECGIEITNHGDKVFYIDEDGNLVTKGYIKAEDLEDPDSGTVINGSLIKSGTIMSSNYLDEDGTETGLGTLINLVTGYTTFKGTYEYAWLNKPKTVHNAQIKMETGRMQIKDLTSDEALYFSHEGISTTEDANQSSGVIDFRSEIYGSSLSDAAYNGLTMQTYGSPTALRALQNQVIIQPNVYQGVNNLDTAANSDDYTSDMFTFSHRNKYETDENGRPVYTNGQTDPGDGLIYYGARTRNDSGGWNQSTCIRMSAAQDNPYTMTTAGDNKTLAPHYSSNMLKPVKKIAASKDEEGRITAMVITLDCYGISADETVTVNVTYDEAGNITAIGDTVIEY